MQSNHSERDQMCTNTYSFMFGAIKRSKGIITVIKDKLHNIQQIFSTLETPFQRKRTLDTCKLLKVDYKNCISLCLDICKERKAFLTCFSDHKNAIRNVSLQNQQEYQEIQIFLQFAYRKI